MYLRFLELNGIASLNRSFADAAEDDRYVIFLDIDNTLYSASSKISEAMGERIHGKCSLVPYH